MRTKRTRGKRKEEERKREGKEKNSEEESEAKVREEQEKHFCLSLPNPSQALKGSRSAENQDKCYKVMGNN